MTYFLAVELSYVLTELAKKLVFFFRGVCTPAATALCDMLPSKQLWSQEAMGACSAQNIQFYGEKQIRKRHKFYKIYSNIHF